MTNETQSINPIKATKPRRWFRFRLRTLLIMVTVLSVGLGWVGWELDQRRGEKAVVTWVEEMGGIVQIRLNPDNRSWWEKTKDKWFGERVRLVSLPGTRVSDLSPLAELKNLELLSLYLTKVTNEQVQELRVALPNCRIIHSTRFEE